LNLLQSQIDVGDKLEDIAGWLEMSSDSLSEDSCLFDIDQCNDGFTVQFWLFIVECTPQVRSKQFMFCKICEIVLYQYVLIIKSTLN